MKMPRPKFVKDLSGFYHEHNYTKNDRAKNKRAGKLLHVKLQTADIDMSHDDDESVAALLLSS